jgi:hypothetical protein
LTGAADLGPVVGLLAVAVVGPLQQGHVALVEAAAAPAVAVAVAVAVPPPAAPLTLLLVLPAVAALAAPVAVAVAALAAVAALVLTHRGTPSGFPGPLRLAVAPLLLRVVGAALGLLATLRLLAGLGRLPGRGVGHGGRGRARLDGRGGARLGGRGRLLARGRCRTGPAGGRVVVGRLDLAVAAGLGQGGRRGAGGGRLAAVPGHLDRGDLDRRGSLGCRPLRVGVAGPAAGPALGAAALGVDLAGARQLRLVGRLVHRGTPLGFPGPLRGGRGGLRLGGRSASPTAWRRRRGDELDTLGLGDDRADQIRLAESLVALDTHGRGDGLQLRQDLSLEDVAFGSCHVHLPCEVTMCRLEKPGTVHRHPVAGP